MMLMSQSIDESSAILYLKTFGGCDSLLWIHRILYS